MEEYFSKCIFLNETGARLDSVSLNVEHGTRYLVNKYVHPDMKVLELGSRYGTVSCVLNYLLKTPKTQLVCVEPDIYVIPCLRKNKFNNNCSFNIYNGTISNDELFVVYNGCGWETKTYKIPPSDINLKSEKIETITLDKIQKLYDITFDCLIADCEGFLLEFLNENLDFLNQLNCIIYEEDCCKNLPINGNYIDYTIIENYLIDYNFICVETFVDNINLNNKCWIKKSKLLYTI
uniref:Methyltransferase FkbM domain-containing protein n=1 Tax=viral metagenome TaxID=1070528 RepID=A0A6C0B1R2_9ZZZZ